MSACGLCGYALQMGHWELPVSEVTSRIAADGRADAWATVPKSRRKGHRNTCRYSTRIDYVFFRDGSGASTDQSSAAAGAAAPGYVPASRCAHVPTSVSGHPMMVVDFVYTKHAIAADMFTGQ